MNRFLVLVVVLALVLGLAAARSEPRKSKGKNKEGGRREGKGNSKTSEAAMGEWTWGECMPNKGSCGRGQKTGNCSGELCEVPTMTADCRVKCTEAAVTTEAPVNDNEAVTPTPPARGGGRPGKGRRPNKDKNGKAQENNENGKGRKEKPPRGERKPNKTDKPAKTKECKYARATLSECDPTTNLQNKTRVLKGTPSSECPEVLVDTVRCDRRTIRQENRHCNYTIGEFGPCDDTTNTRTRQDTLTDPTQVSEECRLVRTVEDKCPKAEGRPMTRCRYNWEQAPACNGSTITLTGSLLIVEDATADCETVRTHQLKCKKEKLPCVLGEWREFGECQDGIRTRTRKLQKGPQFCQRLAREIAICE